MASVLQVATIKDQGGNANAIEIANSSANVTINNLTATTASIPAAAGSSLVLVKSVQGFTVDNDASTASAYIENCFNSTYRDYLIVMTGTKDGTYGDMSFRLGNASGKNSNSHYIFSCKGYDSANTTRTFQGQNTTSAGIFNGADGDSSSFHDRMALSMLMHNPQASGGTSWTGTSSCPRHGTSFIINYLGGMLRTASYSATNMQFFFTAGTATMNFQSYGIKNS